MAVVRHTLNIQLSLFRFDLAVNGGGSSVLRFQRSPLSAASRAVRLPWNAIVAVDDVVMVPDVPVDVRDDDDNDDGDDDNQWAGEQEDALKV